MTTIDLTLTSPKRALFTLRVNGTKRQSYEFTLASRTAQESVAKDAGVPVATLLEWLDRIGRETTTYTLAEPEAGAFSVWYRPIKSPRGDRTTFASASAFLDHISGDRETIVEWDDSGSLGCLDVDYHHGGMPSREWIETTVLTSLLPKPYIWHMTPRGFHAFYPATSTLKGDEIAALAALRWRSLDPNGGVEIKRQLRCPGIETLHRTTAYDQLQSYVTDFLGVGESTVDPSGYLDAEGLEIGQRYDHDRCPIEPTVASDNRKPVVVGEGGIYCHRCAGLGRQLGRHRAGWVPYSHLLGQGGAGVIGTLVRSKTHWGHAQHVLDAYLGITGPVAKLAYAAALKLQHGELPPVFNPVTDTLVRLEGRWATVAEGYTFPKDIAPILRTLPATDGDPATVCLFAQPTIDLSTYGYPSVQVIRGCKLSTRALGTSRLVVASPASWLREYGSVFYPRYIPAESRMSEEEARSVVESVLPGVDWTYIETLLVARGCNEARVGLPQHLLVSGFSKTGKTSHVQLAAGILGDVVTPVPATTDTEKFRSAVRDASERGSFLSLDEFVKDSMRLNPRMTPEQVFEPLLNFDPEGLSHKMYLGPTALGRIGVCVWTDTHFPEVLHDYTQIARRVHVYRLTQKLDWDSHLAAHGISEVRLVRCVSPRHAEACNAILSHVADKYFGCLLTFHQLAEQLGITTLENSSDFYDLKAKRRELYDLVCSAPPLGPVDAKRWPGRGWKLIVRGADDPLSEIWSNFADPGKEWAAGKRVHEKPFNEILETSQTVEVDTRSYGNRMVIRFRVGPFNSPTKVNEEILQ